LLKIIRNVDVVQLVCYTLSNSFAYHSDQHSWPIQHASIDDYDIPLTSSRATISPQRSQLTSNSSNITTTKIGQKLVDAMKLDRKWKDTNEKETKSVMMNSKTSQAFPSSGCPYSLGLPHVSATLVLVQYRHLSWKSKITATRNADLRIPQEG
jgi:hypothetical protein